jgi:uncharacterized protein (DUF4415 family)
MPDGTSAADQSRPNDTPKESINIRLDPDVIAHYRATGAGLQTRINCDLRKAAKLKA